MSVVFKPSEVGSEDFIKALKEGNARAFDALFLKYYARVKRFVFGFCHDEQEAESISQDLFLELWVRREQLEYVQQLDNYIFAMARNAALKLLRQQRPLDYELPQERYVVTNASIEDNLYYQELERLLMETLAHMPQQQRRVFAMSRFEGLSNAAIAEKLNISKRTVESHISSAIAQLRKKLPLFVFLYLTTFNYVFPFVADSF